MRSSDITIRDFVASDLDGVIALMRELQAFERELVPDHAEPTAAFGRWYIARLRREIEERRGVLLVAVQDGGLSGFCAGFEDEHPEGQSNYFYIAELVVAQRERGHGIGTRLLHAIEEVARARGHHTVGIGVLAASDRVHAFYNRLGYRDHAVKLRKQL